LTIHNKNRNEIIFIVTILVKYNKLTDLDEKKAKEIGNVPMVFLLTVPNVANM
jgi:hypothetical protein